MEKPPLISIVTASLNNGVSLTKTLASIKCQTFQSLEHIVIDGGSTDTTIQVLTDSQDDYDLRWISEPDQGISDALNKGILMATGKYILVIQADDFLLGDSVLADVQPVLNTEEYDICSFPVIVQCESGKNLLHKPSRHINQRYHFKNIFRHQGTFVHKRLYDRIGLFSKDYKISMDYDFFYRALSAGCAYSVGNRPVAVMGADGVSRTQSHARIKEEFRVQDSNEKHRFWRLAQKIFRLAYIPYREAIYRLRTSTG